MDDEWSFDDNVPPDVEVEPGIPRCYHCGSPAPEGMPDSHARCEICKRLLHTCYNCTFFDGIGCLILSPYRWRDGAVMGQFCPEFVWRKPQPPNIDRSQEEKPSEESA